MLPYSPDELYDYVFDQDTESLIEYLDSVKDPKKFHFDLVQSLTQYAIAKNKLKSLKVLVCYGGNPESWNNFSLYYNMWEANYCMSQYLQDGKNDDCHCNK